MKKLMSLTLMLCMIASLFTMPVYAADCCYPSIESVEHGAEKTVVNWNLQTCTEDARLKVIVWDSNGNKWSPAAKETVELSGTETSGSVEFDNAIFLNGATCYAAVACESCGEYSCWNYFNQKEFVAENGSMPIYDIGAQLSDEMTISKTADKAIRVKADKAGLYTLYQTHIDVEPLAYGADIVFANANGNYFSDYTLMYFEEGQEEIFTVSLRDSYRESDSITSQFSFAPSSIEIETPATENPSGGDVLYDFEGITEVYSYKGISIPKCGVYKFQCTVDSDRSNAYLYDKTGNQVTSRGAYGAEGGVAQTEAFLSPGTYYLKLYNVSAADVTYTELESIEFDSEIVLDRSTYKTLSLDTYALVSNLFESADVIFYNADDGQQLYGSYGETVLPAGEYIVYISTWAENISGSLTKTDIPTVILGETLSYATSTDGRETKYALLKAPEDGEYVFFFPSTAYGETGYLEGLVYLEFAKDETELVYWRGEDFTAHKHNQSSDSLSLDEKFSATLTDGNKHLFSFTAPEKDTYKINFNCDEWSAVKIYTEDEVVCERGTEDNNCEYVELDKNETVYISLGQTGFTSTLKDTNIWVKVEKKYIDLTETTDIDCSYPADSDVRYYRFIPEEEGFYDFSFALKTLNSNYYQIKLYFNGQNLGRISGWSIEDSAAISKSFYATKENPVEIGVEVTYDQDCTATLKFDRAVVKPIEDMSNFKIEDNSYYSVTLPESGVYKISGTAFYKASSWRDEGEYSYFFDPIIKNYESTSFGYDAQEGEAPVFFCGKKGDEILFKEEVTSEYYAFEYPIKAKISKVDTEEAQLGSLVTTSDQCTIYSINIEKDGVYKFEDFSEELYYPDQGIYYGRGYTYFCDGYEWHYMTGNSTTSTEETDKTFELKAGTYYIAAATYDNDVNDEHIPHAKFKLSVLSTDEPDEEALSISGTRHGISVDYTVKGTVPADATLYIAQYEGEELKSVKLIENPSSEGYVNFLEVHDTDTFIMYLWDEEQSPLCNDAICEEK